MPKVNKRKSIYTQLLQLLIISALAAFLLYTILDNVGAYLVEWYMEESSYVEKRDLAYIDGLQNYIDKNNLSSEDTAELTKWVNNHSNVYLQVYKNDLQIYDSYYQDQEIADAQITAGYYEWETYYDLTCSDGLAECIIYGSYSNQLYNYSRIATICISFFAFLWMVLFGIRRKMAYITKLSSEIEILEGGQLDHPITIRGKDELSALAESLECMRVSFQNLVQQEEEMTRENKRIVTEMSHDIRTPVTSILLYTEILKMGKYSGEEQLQSYLDKIDQKAKRMKQLTDHLFEYSLIAKEEKVQLEEAELYEILFFDLFSETCNYLNQKGFEVDFRVEWLDYKISIYSNYIMRIMDNITSNIIKYADSQEPVHIMSIDEKDHIVFVFENRIRQLTEAVESNGIGLQNIKNMMLKMRGECKVEKTEEHYRILLRFPIC
jgi:signal transduction histidine kinase